MEGCTSLLPSSARKLCLGVKGRNSAAHGISTGVLAADGATYGEYGDAANGEEGTKYGLKPHGAPACASRVIFCFESDCGPVLRSLASPSMQCLCGTASFQNESLPRHGKP